MNKVHFSIFLLPVISSFLLAVANLRILTLKKSKLFLLCLIGFVLSAILQTLSIDLVPNKFFRSVASLSTYVVLFCTLILSARTLHLYYVLKHENSEEVNP